MQLWSPLLPTCKSQPDSVCEFWCNNKVSHPLGSGVFIASIGNLVIENFQSTCSSSTELGDTAFRFAIYTLTALNTGAGIHRYSSRKWASSLTSSKSRFVMKDADIRMLCQDVVSAVDFTVFCPTLLSCCGSQHGRVAGTFAGRLYKRIEAALDIRRLEGILTGADHWNVTWQCLIFVLQIKL